VLRVARRHKALKTEAKTGCLVAILAESDRDVVEVLRGTEGSARSDYVVESRNDFITRIAETSCRRLDFERRIERVTAADHGRDQRDAGKVGSA